MDDSSLSAVSRLSFTTRKSYSAKCSSSRVAVCEPTLDRRRRVGRPAPQPPLELGHRRRQDEDQHALLRPLAPDLGPALPVDVEEVVLAVLERPVDGVDGRSVAGAVDHRPLGELVPVDHPGELVLGDVLVVDAVALAGPRRPRRVRDRELQPLLLSQEVRQRRLARPRGGRNHEQDALVRSQLLVCHRAESIIAVENGRASPSVTRRSGPARAAFPAPPWRR